MLKISSLKLNLLSPHLCCLFYGLKCAKLESANKKFVIHSKKGGEGLCIGVM